MQYWRLLLRPSLRAMGRWQLLQAILLFAGAPLWVLLAVAAVGLMSVGLVAWGLVRRDARAAPLGHRPAATMPGHD